MLGTNMSRAKSFLPVRLALTAVALFALHRGLTGVVKAALPCAGVGIAGTNDDAASVGPRQSFLADAHRSGADAVLREDASR